MMMSTPRCTSRTACWTRPTRAATLTPWLGAELGRIGQPSVAVETLDRHDHVDAVGLAVDVLVDPVQLELQLLGTERQRTQDAHATCPADRGGDITTVREGEDRKLDAEHLTQPVLHSFTPELELVSV